MQKYEVYEGIYTKIFLTVQKLFNLKRLEQKDAVQRLMNMKQPEKQLKLLELIVKNIIEVYFQRLYFKAPVSCFSH